MARTPKQKREITQACRDYPDTGSEGLVLNLIRKDVEIAKWLSTNVYGGFSHIERHHIYGRPSKGGEKNYWCNIIALHRAVHELDHNSNAKTIGTSKKLELCCLHTQCVLQRIHDAKSGFGLVGDEQPESEVFWNVTALTKICGRHTLEGRIEVDLLPFVVGTPLEYLAEELLAELSASDIEF